MIVAGTILVILQVIAVISSFIAGRNPFSGGLWFSIGYFLFGIIGIILIIIGTDKKKEKFDKQQNNAKKDITSKINYNTENNEKINQPQSSSVHPTAKPYKNKSIYGKREFELWLIEKGYKEYTDDGKPSTVYFYSKSINLVIDKENLTSWKDLEHNIDLYIMQYDTGGIKEKIGNLSHRTVINALKLYKDFLTENKTNNNIAEENIMYIKEDVTKAILKVRETQSSDESVNHLLKVIKNLYERDQWICVTATTNDNGEAIILSTYIDNVPICGYYIVAYSDMKYFKNKFGKDIMMTSIRQIVDIFAENNGQCSGIIFNPETEAEMALTPEFIDEVLN